MGQDHTMKPAGQQELHAAAMQLLQAAVQIPESPSASSRPMSGMLVQASYIAFTRLYLGRGGLSAADAPSCSLHAGVLAAAVKSHSQVVRARILQLKVLEVLVRDCPCHKQTGSCHCVVARVDLLATGWRDPDQSHRKVLTEVMIAGVCTPCCQVTQLQCCQQACMIGTLQTACPIHHAGRFAMSTKW